MSSVLPLFFAKHHLQALMAIFHYVYSDNEVNKGVTYLDSYYIQLNKLYRILKAKILRCSKAYVRRYLVLQCDVQCDWLV